jgi:hypothetical protein
MNWRMKAAIMRYCSILPFGDRLYMLGQKKLGRLKANPLERLPIQVKMADLLQEAGFTLMGACLFEVGTGHIPLVPIGFFLSGARRIITVDLHKRLELELTRKSLEWMVFHRDQVQTMYSPIVTLDLFQERFEVLERFQQTPQRFFEEAGIEYLAPQDAARICLPAESVDVHFSVTVLEHIPLTSLKDILIEGKRILKSNGVAIHFIDLSDHFQHQDHSITKINFLRFSETEWEKLAGNEFAYCNRLRARDSGYENHRVDVDVDSLCLEALKNGFRVDRNFTHFTPAELCSVSLRGIFSPMGDSE